MAAGAALDCLALTLAAFFRRMMGASFEITLQAAAGKEEGVGGEIVPAAAAVPARRRRRVGAAR